MEIFLFTLFIVLLSFLVFLLKSLKAKDKFFEMAKKQKIENLNHFKLEDRNETDIQKMFDILNERTHNK